MQWECEVLILSLSDRHLIAVAQTFSITKQRPKTDDQPSLQLMQVAPPAAKWLTLLSELSVQF